MARILNKKFLLRTASTYLEPSGVCWDTDNNKVLALVLDPNDTKLYGFVGTPAGDGITWGSAQTLQSGSTFTGIKGNPLYDPVSGNFVLVGVFTSGRPHAVTISRNPTTDVLTLGTPVQLTATTASPEGQAMLSSGVFVVWGGSGTPYAWTATVSGATITGAAQYTGATHPSYDGDNFTFDTTTNTIIFCFIPGDTYELEYQIATISGSVVSWQARQGFPGPEYSTARVYYDPGLDRVMAYIGPTNVRYGEVNATDITWGSAQTSDTLTANSSLNLEYVPSTQKTLFVVDDQIDDVCVLSEFTNTLTGFSTPAQDPYPLIPVFGGGSFGTNRLGVSSSDGKFVALAIGEDDETVSAFYGDATLDWLPGCGTEFDLGLNIPTSFTNTTYGGYQLAFSGGKVVFFYQDTAAGNSWRIFTGQANKTTGVITQLSDAGMPTGVPNEENIIDVIKVDESTIMMLFTYPNKSPMDISTRLCTFTGTGVTLHSGQILESTANGGNGKCGYDPATGKYIVFWYNSANSNEYYNLGVRSGNGIAWETKQVFDTLRYSAPVRDIVFFGGKVIYLKNKIFYVGTPGTSTVTWGTGVDMRNLYYAYFGGSASYLFFFQDTNRGHLYVAYNDGSEQYTFRVTISGLVPTIGAPVVASWKQADTYAAGYDSKTDTFIAYAGQADHDILTVSLGKSDGAGNIDWCAEFQQEVSDTYPSAGQFSRPIANDPVTGLSFISWGTNSAQELHTIIQPVIIDYSCDTKPKKVILESSPTPGSPGFPGQAYVPGYTIPGYCTEVSVQYVTTPSGTYEYRCVTGPSEESLVLGFPENETICSFTPVVVPQSTDPYAPNYDPNYDPNDAPSTSSFGGLGINITPVCVPPTVVNPIPYIPPSPPIPATAAEYTVTYDLGWNYDVLITSGFDITLSIDNTFVGLSTAGVAIGFSNFTDWGLVGLGKFPLYLYFEGNRVSVIKDNAIVWGQSIRAVDDVFKLIQFGTQVSVQKNDVEIYKADVLAGGRVAAGGIIYKADDKICLSKTEEGEPLYLAESPGISGSGGSDITLPAMSVIGYEGSYGIGDVTLPAPTVAGLTEGHGGAGIDLPALFVSAVEGFGGFALIDLPVLGSSGYASDALSGYAVIDLPTIDVIGADAGGYQSGDAVLPAMTANGSAGATVPVAQGADVAIPHLLFGITGLTGTIGGADISIPPLDAVGAENAIYGELDKSLPALQVLGGQIPVYSGVLDGYFQPLEMSQGFGTTYPPNTLDGSIDGLEGELWGGAYLNQDLGDLEVVTLTGTVTNVGRLDGTFLPMEMNSTGLVGAYGEIAGRLGNPLEGELRGGAFLDGAIPGLVGELSATLGIVGRLDGTFPALTGELSGTVQATGRADITLPALEVLWGILDGYLPGLSGELAQTAITVQDYTAWVMNMKTGAISRYPAYAFNFLCRWHDGNYIVREDGIYLIGGEYDIDQPIEAGFTLPSTDMGVSTEKIAPRLYMQGRMDGQFAVTTMADELDPVRSVSIIRPGVGYHRCKLPRGIRGTHLEFDVDNVSGADFEIEQVDVLVADTGRKI